MIKIPTIEDKIYEIISSNRPNSMTEEEAHKIIDKILKDSGISMNMIIQKMSERVDNGVSIEEQLNLIKSVFIGNGKIL